MDIDQIVSAWRTTFETLTGKRPRFKTAGGTNGENLALQNIQARSRMVLAYFLRNFSPGCAAGEGGLLVLGTSNVDEALRGYMTKYDASSADINPIGSVSKTDLRRFLRWGVENLGYESLTEIVEAVPTAELEPTTETYVQSDEGRHGHDLRRTLGFSGACARSRSAARWRCSSIWCSHGTT